MAELEEKTKNPSEAASARGLDEFPRARGEAAPAESRSVWAYSSGLVQRAPSNGPTESGRDANGVDSRAEGALATAAAQDGRPLPDEQASRFEASLGADLSSVRVHTGAESAAAAHAVGAKAYTFGQDIHFGEGHYAPGTADGDRLLAHEVAHTVQQANGSARRQDKPEVSTPGDALEVEADVAAEAMVTGAPATVSSGSGVARQVMRDDDQPANLVKASRYWEVYGWRIFETATERLEKVALPHPDFTYWLWGRNDSFVRNITTSIDQNGGVDTWNLVLGAEQLKTAIDRGRTANTFGEGPLDWHEEVGAEVAGLLLPLIADSIARLGPQFLAAEYQAWNRLTAFERGDSHFFSISASSFSPSHPIDKHTIAGFVGGQLLVDFQRYLPQAGPVPAARAPVRAITAYTWEIEAFRPAWVRVTAPADPTPEEAASFFYGDASKASLLVAASPEFGIRSPQLTPALRAERWKLMVAHMHLPATAAADPTLDTAYSQNDPIEQLNSRDRDAAHFGQPTGDAARLAQAGKFQATGASREAILERLGLSIELLSSIGRDAEKMPALNTDAFLLGGLHMTIAARLQQLRESPDPAAATKWDAHSAAQFDVLRQVANGMRGISQQYVNFTQPPPAAPGAAKPAATELPDALRQPLYRVGRAYLQAANASDLPDTGEQLIATAHQQEQLYPIEMMEGILQVCREQLASADVGRNHDDAADLQTQEQALRARVFALRQQLVTDPAGAQAAIAGIMDAVQSFQDSAQLVSTMGSIIQEWEFLIHNSNSLMGTITGKDRRYFDKMKVLEGWENQYRHVYLALKYAGNDAARKKAQEDLRALRAQGADVQKDIHDIAEMITKEETRQKWLELGGRVALMIGVAVVTAGIGTYVEGALLVGAGWGATTAGAVGAYVVGSGVEAASFTAITTTMFEKDPSIKGVLGGFFENWALFGAMKGLGALYEGAVGTEVAATTMGRVGNMATTLAANIGYTLFRADQENRKNGGNGLTDEQKRDLVIEGVATFVGSMIAMRYSRGFLEGINRSGQESWLAKVATIDTQRTATLNAARALGARSPLDQVRGVVEQDSATLKGEIDVLREVEQWARANPAAARRLGLNADVLATQRQHNESEVVTRQRVSIGMQLESAGGDLFRCDADKLDHIAEQLKQLGDKVTDQAGEAGERGVFVLSADGSRMRIVSKAATNDAATAAPTRTDAPPPPDGGHPRIRPIDTSRLPEGQQDVARWQSHGLETDPRAAELMKNALFREWYARWMEMPNRLVADGNGYRVNYPEGAPPEIRKMIDSVASGGNVKLTTHAVDVAAKLASEYPQLSDMNPQSAEYQALRPKLVHEFGDPAIQRYEQTMMRRAGDPARAELDHRVGSILADNALGILRSMFPDCQIMLTGSIAQASKRPSAITDVDIVIVAPEGTAMQVRAAMEHRANAVQLPTSEHFAAETKHAELPVDSKVVTPEEFFGLASAAPTPGRTPMPYLRVDQRLEGQSDLHNHLLGVPDADYFIQHAGEGKAVKLFDRTYQIFVADPALQGRAPDSWKVAQDAQAKIADLKKQPGKEAEIAEIAKKAIDKLFAASEETPFDSSYEVRDEIIKKYIGYEAFTRDSMAALRKEGVAYSEQSVSLNKLKGKFTPEMMERVHEQLAKQGKDTDVRFLGMLPTTEFSADPTNTKAQASFDADLKTLESLLSRGDVIGVDIAGPERNPFTASGMANFGRLFETLQRAAKTRGRPLVLRPHVGEGYNPPGAPEDAEHVKTAQKNLDMLLDEIQLLAKRGLYTGNPQVDGVIVRFGHATHVTPAQLARIHGMGITVEANVGSNIATGTIASRDEHPLLYNLYYDVRTVLATDGQGVMNTTVPNEMANAAQQIKNFQDNLYALQIDGQNKFFRDLDQTIKDRFSMETLRRWADEYQNEVRAGDPKDKSRRNEGR